MKICPNCAKEHDEHDVICVYCGHVETPSGKPVESPIVSAPHATVKTPPASPPPGNLARYGLYGTVAVGVVVAAMFIMRSAGKDASPAAAASAARAVAPVPESESTAAPKWQRTRQSGWASDGSRTLGYELEAERSVAVYLDRVRPILAVRCISRSMETFVVLQSAASIESSGTHSVRISLD